MGARIHLLVAALVLLAGCIGSPASSNATATASADAAPPTTSGSSTPERPAALEASLYRLVVADNRTAYARQHDLDYRNGTVAVVVHLAPGARLPSGYDVSVLNTDGNRVLARVPVSSLVPLAREANVTAVTPPREVRQT